MASYETRTRTAVRSIIWRIFGVILTVALTVAFGGSVKLAVELGVTYNVIRLVTHYFHDRAWAHIQWGITLPTASPGSAVEYEEVTMQCKGLDVYRGFSSKHAWQVFNEHRSADCLGPHNVIVLPHYKSQEPPGSMEMAWPEGGP